MRKTHRKDERREKISTKKKRDNDCRLCFNMYDRWRYRLFIYFQNMF